MVKQQARIWILGAMIGSRPDNGDDAESEIIGREGGEVVEEGRSNTCRAMEDE